MLESIRLHQASLKQYQRALRRLPQSESLEILQLRMEDVDHLLNYYADTTLTILEQQRNLLSLVRRDSQILHLTYFKWLMQGRFSTLKR